MQKFANLNSQIRRQYFLANYLANLIRVVLFRLSLSWPSALEVPF